jgi:predicted RNase H-like HicB family nuclease
MKRYAIVLERAKRNYAAYVPDLPGCIATGVTVEEAEKLLREAIEVHIAGLWEDGLPVPEPSSVVDYLEVEEHMSVTMTSEELRACAQNLQGKPLHKVKWDRAGTPSRGEPFRVEKVEGDSIFFDPAREPRRSGHTRSIQEQICKVFNDTQSLDPSVVKKAMAKKNHWYVSEDLALIVCLLAERVRHGQAHGLPGVSDENICSLAEMVRGS